MSHGAGDGFGSGLVVKDTNKDVTEWAAIRSWVLDRDRHLCQICLEMPATEVDHVWPRKYGGRDHIENLRAACGDCNRRKGDRISIEIASSYELEAGRAAVMARVERELRDFQRFAVTTASRGWADGFAADCDYGVLVHQLAFDRLYVWRLTEFLHPEDSS